MQRRRLGRVVAGCLATALALVYVAHDGATRNAHAQEIPWQTPVIIQNVDTVNATAVQVDFVSFSSGQVVRTLSLGPLAAGRSVVVRPQAIPDLPSGQYSAVVASDAKVAAVVNQTSGALSGAYLGAPSSKLVGSSVSFPNVVRNYAGWNSPLYIQNAGSSDTNVTVSFFRIDSGSKVRDLNAFLRVGQTYHVDPATVSGLSDGTQYSVVATSSSGQPLAGMVNQVRSGNVVMTYDGLASGGTTVYLPNITRNYFGWNTPFIVQNVGTTNTQVTARYYRFSDGAEVKVDGPYTIGPGRSIAFRPHTTAGLSDNTQYSVVVQSSGQPIVSVVNQTRSSGDAMAYEGITP